MKQTSERVSEIQVSYHPEIASQPIIITALAAHAELVKFFPTNTIALQERFVALYLNRANRVLGVYELSNGGMTGTVADIRLVFAVALKIAATSIILAHNHPSGNLKPSVADFELTARFKEGGKILDIKVIDHLIISPIEREYYSFADEGEM